MFQYHNSINFKFVKQIQFESDNMPQYRSCYTQTSSSLQNIQDVNKIMFFTNSKHFLFPLHVSFILIINLKSVINSNV